MSGGAINAIPAGFLSRLLDEFGIQWTHLVIISGVVFSSFHLEQYLNPGIWILGTVGSFSVVYLFHRQVSDNFPKVALFAAVAVTVGIAAPLLVFQAKEIELGKFMRAWTALSTLYLTAVISGPLGTAILSYRLQDEFLRAPLSDSLTNALDESVRFVDFVHSRVDYIIDLISDGESDVILRCNVTMNMVNRSKSRSVYRDIFDPAGRERKFIRASINGNPIDCDDPERLSERGLHVDYECGAGEEFRIEVVLESKFYRRDSELVGTYLPAEALSILIRPSSDLRVTVQSLLRKKVELKRLESGHL